MYVHMCTCTCTPPLQKGRLFDEEFASTALLSRLQDEDPAVVSAVLQLGEKVSQHHHSSARFNSGLWLIWGVRVHGGGWKRSREPYTFPGDSQSSSSMFQWSNYSACGCHVMVTQFSWCF